MRGCSAILLLHLKNPRILRKFAATRDPRTRVQLCGLRKPGSYIVGHLLGDPRKYRQLKPYGQPLQSKRSSTIISKGRLFPLPSIQKTLRAHAKRVLRHHCRKRLREITLGELFLGRLRIFVVAIRFLAVYVACFQEWMCAMAAL